jgi:hypothetical protein
VSDDELPDALLGGSLPSAYQRWRLELAPGSERDTSAAEWAGALVLIESGTIDVGCLAGGQRTFVEGDLLALGWLPLKWMRNPGADVARLVAVRRRNVPPPPGAFIRVGKYRSTIDS